MSTHVTEQPKFSPIYSARNGGCLGQLRGKKKRSDLRFYIAPVAFGFAVFGVAFFGVATFVGVAFVALVIRPAPG